MRKRRSTVYVRPGKDVTLYIPTDTPSEVIDYLNRLKEEGTFSQGVMEMIESYVQGRGDLHSVREHTDETGWSEENDMIGNAATTNDEQSERERDDDSTYAVPSKKLNLAQIFLQSKKNTGKLLDPRDDT